MARFLIAQYFSKEVMVDGSKSYFDTRTDDHPHFYWEDDNKLTDAPAEQLQIRRLPDAPDGMEVAKAIALGADLAGLAFPFLQAASSSEEALDELIELLIAEIKTVLFCTGNANLTALKRSQSLSKIG